jgi:hypothetical protein
VVARFIDGLRQLNGVIAGITAMPWRQFLLYNMDRRGSLGRLMDDGVVPARNPSRRDGRECPPVQVVGDRTRRARRSAYALLHVRHVRRRRARDVAETFEIVQTTEREESAP